MKVILIILSLLLVTVSPIFAQDATSTGKTPRINKVQTVKEKMASREAALKAKLQAFRDKKKAEVAERVNTNLNRINKNQTDQMLKHLDKMSSILDRLEARVSRGSPDIKDPAAAKAAIAASRSQIASATAAVKAQAEKDYTIEISSESKVREDAKRQREALHADLKAVRSQVIAARQSVANAIRVAKSGKVEIPKKEGTNSGQ